MQPIILDVATCPLPEAAQWLSDEPIEAPAHYKNPDAIAGYVKAEQAKRLERAALDPDCCMISAVGWFNEDMPENPTVRTIQQYDETELLFAVGALLRHYGRCITFNGLKFDLPILQRRAWYLGVDLDLNLDRYKTTHIDLYDKLINRGLSSAHSLSWYRKRFGWTDIPEKPLRGAEEAKAPALGKWDELIASVRHDVQVTARLAERLRVISGVWITGAEKADVIL
jgi:DNA polymerase elongation subunit (family B)